MTVVMGQQTPGMISDAARLLLLPEIQRAYGSDETAKKARDMKGVMVLWPHAEFWVGLAALPSSLAVIAAAKPFEARIASAQQRMPQWGRTLVGLCLLARPLPGP